MCNPGNPPTPGLSGYLFNLAMTMLVLVPSFFILFACRKYSVIRNIAEVQ